MRRSWWWSATANRWNGRGTRRGRWPTGTGWSWSGRWPVGEGRRERLARSRLYVVTDAPPRRGGLEGVLDAVLGAGGDIVQLREEEGEAGGPPRGGAGVPRGAGRPGPPGT